MIENQFELFFKERNLRILLCDSEQKIFDMWGRNTDPRFLTVWLDSPSNISGTAL